MKDTAVMFDDPDEVGLGEMGKLGEVAVGGGGGHGDKAGVEWEER